MKRIDFNITDDQFEILKRASKHKSYGLFYVGSGQAAGTSQTAKKAVLELIARFQGNEKKEKEMDKKFKNC